MDRSAPRVSIVMPVFNEARLLAAALDSVQAQSVEDFECVVVDDGSTDATPEILAAYAGRDPRFLVVTQPNQGLPHALNTGLAMAQGEWIARLDGDDLMLPNRLERQLAFVEAAPDLAACGCWYDIIDMAGRRRGTRYPQPLTREQLDRMLEDGEALTFTHPTMLYRRELALQLGGYRAQYYPSEDIDLFARMLATGAAILIQPEVLMQYRIRPSSISGRTAVQQFQAVRWIYHNFYAERAGRPTLDLAGFRAFQARQPVWTRLGEWSLATSDRCYRRYSAAMMADQPVRAGLYLAAASALRPAKAVRRGLRSALALTLARG